MRSLLLVILFCLATACEHPQIFSTNTPDKVLSRSDEAPEMITVKITGGFAGVNQELIIRQGGFIEFRDNYPFGGSYSDVLAPDAFASLHSLFLDNNFTRLQERYITENTADFIYYEISFIQSDLHKTVYADFSAAPLGLKTIINHLNEMIQNLTREGLKLHLKVSKDSLHVGESVALELVIQNITDQNITLYFQDGQRFNFIARGIQADSQAGRSALQMLWNWQQDKVFDQATHTIDLPAGDVLEYTFDWGGRDDAGNLIAGDIWLSGKLVSTPGGTTPAVRVYVAE